HGGDQRALGGQGAGAGAFAALLFRGGAGDRAGGEHSDFAAGGGGDGVFRGDAGGAAGGHGESGVRTDDVDSHGADSVELDGRREELKLKFAGPPAPIARGFRATVKDPFGNVMLLLDRAADGAGDLVEDAKSGGSLFAGVEQRVAVKRDLLIKVYQEIGRTA